MSRPSRSQQFSLPQRMNDRHIPVPPASALAASKARRAIENRREGRPPREVWEERRG